MSKPKVLFYDLETSPNLGYVWGKYDQNVLEFKKQWELLSVAYKWQGEPKVHCLSRPDFKDGTDKSLTHALWKLFDQADIVIAHNGMDFDDKKARAKFIEHGLQPPSTFKSIDTKRIAKSQFNFNSNSLNDLGQLFKLGKKLETGGIQLWLDCMAGDKAAWKRMIAYNKQDVALLEKVYNRMRAWAPNHPNFALIADRSGCPVCLSVNTQRRGYAVRIKTKAQRFQCMDCGHWFTGKSDKRKAA